MKTIEIPKDLLDKCKWMANHPDEVQKSEWRMFNGEVEFDDWICATFEIKKDGKLVFFRINWYDEDGELLGTENGRFPKNGMEGETYYCYNLDNDEEHAVMVLAK